MKKLILILCTALLGLSACNSDTDKYELSGKIEGLENQEMILQFVTFKNITDIDTTSSDAEGNYEFMGKTAEPGFYRISANGKYWMLRLENEEVVYNAKFDDDELVQVEVLKSEKAQVFQEIITFFIKKQAELNAFGQQYQTKQMAGATMVELKAIEEAYLVAEKNMNTAVKDRINNTSDPISGIYLMSAIKSNDDLSFIKEKLNAYSITMPNSTYIIEMREQIKNNEDAVVLQKAQEAAQAASSKNVAIGIEAPDIIQKTPQGGDLSLSSLKGKVVLIDFWASWCKPCRMENPNIVAAYNKYKSKGFTVYSVSLDKERGAWMNAIAVDGLTWPSHVSDLQFWNNAAAKLYGVTGIPAAFLIDENGVIIGKDLRGEALEAKLKEVLE
jgi:thiol-disulfide isomerase/thioredoxin